MRRYSYRWFKVFFVGKYLKFSLNLLAHIEGKCPVSDRVEARGVFTPEIPWQRLFLLSADVRSIFIISSATVFSENCPAYSRMCFEISYTFRFYAFTESSNLYFRKSQLVYNCKLASEYQKIARKVLFSWGHLGRSEISSALYKS